MNNLQSIERNRCQSGKSKFQIEPHLHADLFLELAGISPSLESNVSGNLEEARRLPLHYAIGIYLDVIFNIKSMVCFFKSDRYYKHDKRKFMLSLDRTFLKISLTI